MHGSKILLLTVQVTGSAEDLTAIFGYLIAHPLAGNLLGLVTCLGISNLVPHDGL